MAPPPMTGSAFPVPPAPNYPSTGDPYAYGRPTTPPAYSAPQASYGPAIPPGAPSTWSSPGGVPSGPARPAMVPLRPGDPVNYHNAFKPGIVTIRPMSISDLFGGAIGLLRFNPKSSLGLTAIMLIVGMVLAIPLGLLVTSPAVSGGSQDIAAALGVGGALGLPAILTALITTPMLTRVTYEAVLGHKPTINELWSQTRSRIWAYIGTTIVVTIAAGVVAVASSLAFALVLGRGGDSVGALLGLLVLSLAAPVVALAITSKLGLYPAAVVLEGYGLGSLRRSWQLTSGHFWRNLGCILLAGLMLSALSWVFAVPLGLLSSFFSVAWGSDSAVGLILSFFTWGLSQLLVLSVSTPFMVAFMALLWTDMKIRKEGFDLILMEQAERGSSVAA